MIKDRKYTEQQEKFLEALSDSAKGNVKLAMEQAGYSKNIHVNYIYSTLSEEITEIAQQLLASESIKAVTHLINVLEDPNQLGAKNKLSAIREVLDRAGVNKREKIEISGTDAIFILPAKKKPTDDDSES